MKKNFGKLCLGGVLLFSLSMSLTSCEDILGHWEKPVPNTVTPGGGSTVSVTGISLNQTTLSMKVGDADVTLTANVTPDNATDKAVTWGSDNEAAATVTDGVVHAVAMGTAIITAKAGDQSATCEVTVTAGLSTPLTLEVLTAGTIVVNSPKSGMQYSTDGGVTKTTMTATTTIPNTGVLAVGTKVEFYGSGTTITSYYGTTIVGGTAEVKVYGNIMSLVDETGFATNIKLPAADTFYELFLSNNMLTDASGLLLPATTLAGYCYYRMFDGCTSLTTAPKELPATTLDNYCYYLMFSGCTSLTTAPELKATTLANFCCGAMFSGCTALTTAPELKAETLKPSCYNTMFYNCSKLSSVICLATDITATGCSNTWLDGAGTDASVTSRTLHIKIGQSTTDGNWKLSNSGDGGSNKWTAVADQ